MSAIGKIYDLSLEVRTPVHIGSGKELTYNSEYLNFGQDGVVIADEEKIYHLLGDDLMQTWIWAIENREDILPVLRRRKPDLKPEEVARWILKGRIAADKKQNLKAQIRSGRGTPLIPGSSLKGAMRTAYLTEQIELKLEKNENFKLIDLIDLGRNPKNVGTRMVAEFLNEDHSKLNEDHSKREANFDHFRFLQVSDAEMDTDTLATTGIILELSDKGVLRKDKRPLFHYETIPKGAKAGLRIKIDELPDRWSVGLNGKDKAIRLRKPFADLDELFEVINKESEWLLDWELYHIKSSEGSEAGVFREELRKLKKELETLSAEGSALMRVGHGSGWHFMTGGWAYDDEIISPEDFEKIKKKILDRKYRKGASFPRSRKATSNGMPFGFVILKKCK